MKRPKKKFINEQNLYPNRDIINDCEVRRQGYNQCKDEFDAYLPSEKDIKLILAKGSTSIEYQRMSDYAKALHKRIRE